MSRAPLFSGKEIIRALGKTGYYPVRQRGSHIRLACRGKKTITVPNHPEIGRGLLIKILRDAELPLGEFLKLVK